MATTMPSPRGVQTMQQQQTRAPTDGSRTLTLDPAQPNEANGADEPEPGPSLHPVLRLRGMPPRDAPRVQWDEEVIDNEGMGRKKSKICCIYHKPRAFDESSSSSSSGSSDTGGDDGGGPTTDGDAGGAKPGDTRLPPHNRSRKRKSNRPHCDAKCDHPHPVEPNAYEKG